MKKFYLLFIAGFITVISFGQAFGDIIITEIMQNPDVVTDENGEYFEVYNTTSSDIDMNGWVISDEDLDFHIIGSSLIVPANGYAVLARNSTFAENGNFNADYMYSGFLIANDNDEIILTSGVTEIDRVEYDGGPNFPDPTGASMELHLYKYDGVSNNTGSNWGIATTAYREGGDLGTPRTNNSFGLSVVKNQIEGFAMYPNPVVNGDLFLTSNSLAFKQIEIYDLNGRFVYNNSVQTNEPINISNLNRGIYFVRIEEKGKIATRKLVVN